MNADTPAGFWIRALAFVVDAAVLAFVQGSFSLAAAIVFGVDAERAWGASGTVGFFTLVFAAVYQCVLHASAGQTLGKALMRVRVVAMDGELPAAGAVFLRFIVFGLTFLTLGLGFFVAALRTDKRALHDLIAGTRVERVRPPIIEVPPADEPAATSTS